MPQLTKRQIFSITASAALLKSVFQRSCWPTEKTVLEVALNENPFGPSPRAERALTSELRSANRYGDGASADRLVEQIANVDAGQPAGLTGLGEEMD